MSSNVIIPFFNLSSKIEILQDEEDQPFFKRVHLGNVLKLEDIRTSARSLSTHEQRTRSSFQPTRQPGCRVGQDLKINKIQRIFSCL